eukprot:CFRG8617T1
MKIWQIHETGEWDMSAFAEVDEGFVVAPEATQIENQQPFLDMIHDDTPCPASVNPSTWRQGQLLTRVGVYKVRDNVYQVRGFDLAVMTIMEAPDGLVVFDPLGSVDAAKSAFNLYVSSVAPQTGANATLAAVIFTHSHVDHFGGALGLVDDPNLLTNGSIPVIVPKDFTHAASAENFIIAGSMTRRALYQFGNLLEVNENASIHSGLAFTNGMGDVGLARPTFVIEQDVEVHTIAGLTLAFELSLNTEAPSEMMIWVEEWGLLNCGETAVMTAHNLLTLRGSKARDPMLWVAAIQNAMDRHGEDINILIGQHHWPKIGNDKVIEHLTMARDYLKFTHDQTVRYINLGFTMEEISETVTMPPSIDSYFNTRGHYGHIKHNTKEVYQFYVGWWDGNPSNFQRLPPVERAQQLVADIGGIDEVIVRGKWHRDNGNYRWCAELMSQATYAEPSNMDARYIQADCLEQIGYTEESGIRRNYMLTGVRELREGVQNVTFGNVDAGVKAISLSTLLQGMETRIIPEEAELAISFSFNVRINDTDEKATLSISHSVLISKIVDVLPKSANFTIEAIDNAALVAFLVEKDFNGVHISGDVSALVMLTRIISTDVDTNFDIVAPRTLYKPKAQNMYPGVNNFDESNKVLIPEPESVMDKVDEQCSNGSIDNWVIGIMCAVCGALVGVLIGSVVTKHIVHTRRKVTSASN